MTRITQRMREELVRRNYAETTIGAYLHTVEEFQQHFQKRLDDMTPDDIRRYQVGPVLFFLREWKPFSCHGLRRATRNSTAREELASS